MNRLSRATYFKEKLLKASIIIFSMKKWQLLVGVVITAELFAFTMNSIQSFLWWGYWSADLIMIGTIDALFIAGVMAPILIALVGQQTKYQEYKRKAEAEAKKQAEISEEEKKFRLFIENAVDVVTVLDSKGYILFESPSVKKNFGYEPSELIGRNVFEFVHPDDARMALEVFTSALKKPNFIDILELRFLRKDGVWAYVRVSGKNMIEDPVINGIILNTTDITERLEIENQLKRSIIEKETLMKEIHHRVKNNFMTVSSLLFLQSQGVADPNVKEIFTECQNRIHSMALIHEKLYQSETFSEIEANSYIQRLVSFIRSSYVVNSADISLNLDIDTKIKLVPSKAISLGLIINELLSNIFKYAFPSSKNGIVGISLLRNGENYCLTVKDNGVGLPEEYDASNSNSLGLKLVQMLSKQMDGKFSINKDNGTQFKIIFPA